MKTDPNVHRWIENPTQAQCDHWNTLRAYETAHKVWMNTPTHTEAGVIAKQNLAVAREAYLEAYKANKPNHIII